MLQVCCVEYQAHWINVRICCLLLLSCSIVYLGEFQFCLIFIFRVSLSLQPVQKHVLILCILLLLFFLILWALPSLPGRRFSDFYGITKTTKTTRKTFGTQFYDMVEFHFQCEDDNISSKKNFSSNFCFSLCLLLLILCFYSHRTHRPFMLTLSPYSVHATNLREADWIALRQKTHIILLEKSKIWNSGKVTKEKVFIRD